MVKFSNKFSLKKRVRNTKKNVEQAQEATTDTVNKHLVRRWGKLREVRRFVIGWLVLVAVLALGVIIQSGTLKNYYMEDVPVAGGTYLEGVVGEFSSLNPIFAISAPDSSVTKLVFSSLLKYDDSNTLVGDLATEWEMDEKELVYTVKLRNDVYWQDGQKFTAADVVFTYEAIQSPDTSSPLAASWRGVEIKALDEYTVSFTLPNEYTPFLHSLTNGIIAKHLFDDVTFEELRASDQNFEPIGTGPFQFARLFASDERSQVNLVRNESYYAGAPYIDEFVMLGYDDYGAMLDGFRNGELTAITSLRSFDLDELADLEYAKEVNSPLFNQVYIFLNTKDPLLKNSTIRKALALATDRNAIFGVLGGRYPIGDSPLLKDQLGYDDKLVQPKLNVDKANKLLDKAGWVRGKDGIRIKDNKQLQIDIVSQNSDEYPGVLAQIQRDWLKVGIVVNLSLISDQEFTQNYIAPHDYQALIFGVTQGVDPDVFPYWHSSQAKTNGFNLSNYNNKEADLTLEAGRTRSDPNLRVEKYKAFLEQWMKDNPAIALYRPVFNYMVRTSVKGIEPRSLAAPVDRFNDVTTWSVKTQQVRKEL